MSFHKTYANHIVSDIARLVYHFYRKGVMDGAESGDEWAVKGITERDDFVSQFRYLSEFSQKCIDFNIMCNFIQSQFAAIKPRAIHHWFFKVSGSYNVKKAICLICDEYYRLGLSDGLKIGRNGATKFMSARRSFAQVGETRKNEEMFLIGIKMTALRVQVERVKVSVEMKQFIAFISTTIRNQKDYYFKIKNEML